MVWHCGCLRLRPHRRIGNHQRGLIKWLGLKVLHKWQEIVLAVVMATLPVMAGAGLAMLLYRVM